MGKIHGIPIELSKIIIYPYSSNRGMIEHTSPQNAQRIMQYVKEELYPEALKEEDPQKLTEKLGEIFWWICQAKPWNFGDPSIAETLIRTLWTLKGRESPPWKKNLIPWVKVMVEPDVEEFAKNFHTLFKSNDTARRG